MTNQERIAQDYEDREAARRRDFDDYYSNPDSTTGGLTLKRFLVWIAILDAIGIAIGLLH